MAISAILIDDEKHCTEILEWEIQQHCPNIEILGISNNAQKGLTLISELKPDVVFLDIEMPVMNGFELLQNCSQLNFEVIFTTAYDQFAIKAIRVSALDYLLKPINKTELITAVSKLEEKLQAQTPNSDDRFHFLMDHLSDRQGAQEKIVLPLADGLEILEIKRILYARASSNYTELNLDNGSRIVLSKTLKQVEEMLADNNFLRVHQSFLVNLDHVIKYVRGGGGYLILKDKSTVNVANSKKELLVERLHTL